MNIMTIAKQVTKKSYIQSRFSCRECGKTFVYEERYLAHKCKQMIRNEEFQSPMGQAALSYYHQWFRAMKKMPPPAKSFISSRYYRTFLNFAAFVARVDLPRPDKFIWFMKERDYPPTLWMSDEVYVEYLEFLDYKTQPLEQAKLSVETLLNIADKAEIDVQDVFDNLHPNDLIHHLRTRRLSPWLLLNSKKFKQYFLEKMTPEQKIILEAMIRIDTWADKFEDNPNDVAKIKRLVAELNI